MVLDIPLLIGYMTAVTLLTITPGVDTALIIQSSLGKTASAAGHAAVGILAGCAAWGLIVAGGLGAVVASSGTVYAAFKTMGAACRIACRCDAGAIITARMGAFVDHTQL